MEASCRRRDRCRLCDGDALTPVLSLAPTPPANAFVAADALDAPQPVFPLEVFFCESCAHVQLLDVVDPRLLFEGYVYVSGTSPSFVRHFEDYAADVRARFVPPPASLVVDIGSNDGTLLGFFRDAGFRVLGIDPARDIAAAASAKGIETIAAFFTPDLARRIRADHGAAAVVTANNVFAHVDDLAAMAEGIRHLLADDGVFVFEVSYLVDVYEDTLFDTIYHEHLAYHAVKPLARFFPACGLDLIDTRRVAAHGGSLRGVVQRLGGPRPHDPSVAELIALEESLGLDRADTLRGFGARIDTLKARLADTLATRKAEGRRIAGFGAPAKATTLLYHFGIGPDVIDFIVDDSPLKQGLFTPGMHIPVLPATALYERRPDDVIVLAWNFARSIMDNHAAFRQDGGHFIVPLPRLEIH